MLHLMRRLIVIIAWFFVARDAVADEFGNGVLSDADAVSLLMEFAKISDTVLYDLKLKYMGTKLRFDEMEDIPGTEGHAFNLQKKLYKTLPKKAKRFIDSVFRFAFLQLDEKITREQSAHA
ncbi:hypothetical protein TELCIR_15371 [Teladorsagia circumcincta]|uniref:Uncharacterized protein n=1 Tax=Teladorsagia circumcincta TaxID=45464 RepID=A0A2G9TYP2_TELCI|nr:hypothetical protein TELCIR_15371 [Teladorsagia circumcincta]